MTSGSGDGPSSKVVNLTVVTGGTNQINQAIVAAPDPGAEIESQGKLKVFLNAIWSIALWLIKNPEWLLKWSATILLFKLFFTSGFSVQTLQEFQGKKAKPTPTPSSVAPSIPALPIPNQTSPEIELE